MIAGLLFAHHDAEDRPGQLTATLPFGGSTVIEYQARLLVAGGAAQIVVVVGRLTPELLGALGRIGRRGVAIDAVRSAEEATAKLHPLSRVLMIADGLITTQAIIDGVAAVEGEALLVEEAAHAPEGYERLGGGAAWAGIARLDARRLAEVAALPRDYDLQSTVLRLADQARAIHLMLPPGAAADGHGIERAATPLAERGRAVLAATVADRRNWFNAVLVAPVARWTVPTLVARGVGTVTAAGGAMLLGLCGIATVGAGVPAVGLVFVTVAVVVLGVVRALGALRDEQRVERGVEWSQAGLPAVALLLLGWGLLGEGEAIAAALTAGVVALAALAERAALPRLRRRWWGSPPAYLLVTTIGTLAGVPLAGIAGATFYAGATLAAAIEALRMSVRRSA